MVDFARHEALYRVDTDYAVEAFLPLWLDLDHYLSTTDSGDRSDAEGLLVAVESPTEAARLRRWLRAAKATLAEAVEEEYLTPAEARTVLDRATRRRVGERNLTGSESTEG
jgi:hypothetical protein